MNPTEEAQAFESLVLTVTRMVKEDRGSKFEDRLNEIVSKPWIRRSCSDPDALRAEALRRHEEGIARQWSATDPKLLRRRDRPGSDAWFDGELPDDGYWSAFKQALEEEGDLLQDDIDSLCDVLRRVITQLPDPNGMARTVFGLIFGRVQAGKTTIFNALVAVLADLGYTFFIVLAGRRNNLRGQTQRRTAKTVTDLRPAGWASQDWSWLTGPEDEADIEPELNPGATFRDNRRVVLVVKKEPTRLRNLDKFIRTAGTALNGRAVLVVDDECDEASVDTGVNRPSAISKQISDILRSLEKEGARTAYVGVTATPYANLLIDPEPEFSLFPRDFAVALPKSVNYFGGEEFFGRDAIDESDSPVEPLGLRVEVSPEDVAALRPPSNTDPSFARWEPKKVESLVNAVSYFVLASAARRARGQIGHSSMLIHVHHQTDVMDKLRPVVEEIVEGLVTSVKREDLAALEELWNEELGRDVLSKPRFADSDLQPVSFDELRPFLSTVLEAAAIKVDHSGPDADRLKYGSEPSTVIVIGANTMSRGLTLNGLVTSYFIRPMDYADSLLQACRWFGYRPGYGDLQRVWTTDDLCERMEESTLAESKQILNVERHAREGLTPLEARLRISKPDSSPMPGRGPLRITSPAKMGEGVVVREDFAGSEKSSNRFSIGAIENNLDALKALLGTCAEPESTSRGHLHRDVGGVDVCAFLRGYQMPEGADDNRLVAEYIDAQLELGRLLKWNVFVHKGPGATVDLGNGHSAGAVERRARSEHGVLTTGVITDPKDRFVDLPPEHRQAATKGAEYREVLDIKALRNLPPLLIIYLITPKTAPKPNPLSDGECLVGWSADFPGLQGAKRASFIVNRAIERRG